jgi:hypothetical protein
VPVLAPKREPFVSRSAGRLNDLYCYDPTANTWKAISPSGPTPPKVYTPGFASAPDGMIYNLGGDFENCKVPEPERKSGARAARRWGRREEAWAVVGKQGLLCLHPLNKKRGDFRSKAQKREIVSHSSMFTYCPFKGTVDLRMILKARYSS